jgi:putative intracellular protease/amidase
MNTVGVLLFEGFELLDVFGPLEAWGMLAAAGDWRVVTTAAAPGPVASAQGVARGGRLFHGRMSEARRHPRARRHGDETRGRERGAARVAPRAEVRGTGRDLRLHRRRATTNKASFAWVVGQGPAVSWVKQARWVEDGPFVTSSGVSPGIDMTLAVIESLESREVAEKIAVQMEYDWHRDASWDPFDAVHGLV